MKLAAAQQNKQIIASQIKQLDLENLDVDNHLNDYNNKRRQLVKVNQDSIFV